ncbi:ER membrane protein DP1/Yop1 [Rhizophlyctis rosea]|uniref:Protein YOP1 n=1 Tax=Rhizophlyctis rosea TaxID=64517 RepID=A0AAD5SBH3_9FUNG|nr:ER membrane protein DP1/Yop1 [Rhizophlyctis rosea]
MAIFVPSVGLNPVSRDDISSSFQSAWGGLDKFLGKIGPLTHLEKELSIHKIHLAFVGLLGGAGFGMVIGNVHGGLVTDLCGYMYPAYMTLKAMGSDQAGVQTKWLGYWPVFGFFNIIEYFQPMVLKMLPFYFTIKLATIFWLVSPSTQGSVFIYEILLKHFIPLFDAIMAFVLPTPEAVAKRFQPAEAAAEAPAESAAPAEVAEAEAKEEVKKEETADADEKKEEAPKKPASVNFLGIAPGAEKKKPTSIVFGPQFRGVAADRGGPKVKWGYVRVR